MTAQFTIPGLPHDLIHLDRIGDRSLRVRQVTQAGRLVADDHDSIMREGRAFSADTCIPNVSSDVSNNLFRRMVITPSAGNYPQVLISYAMEAKGAMSLWILDVAPTSGTAIVPVNLNHNRSQTFLGTVLRDPTVDLTGATFMGGQLADGAGQGAVSSGNRGARPAHVLQPGKHFMIQLQNLSNNTTRACINVELYNDNSPEVYA